MLGMLIDSEVAWPETSRFTKVRSLDFLPLNTLSIEIEKQMRVVASEVPDSLALFGKQKPKFEQADLIVVDCNPMGLGDSLMQARCALAIAGKISDKSFAIRMPKAVMEMRYLKYPSNTQIISHIPRDYLDRDQTFFMTFDHNGLSIPHVLVELTAVEHLREDNRIFKPDMSSITGYSDFWRPLGIDHGRVNYNLRDLRDAVMAYELGVLLTEADLRQSFLHFDHSVIWQNPQVFQLLVAPDAREQPASGDNRSQKSLSAGRWKQVFAALPKSLEIGIVMGHSHPRYCKRVLKAARSAGLNAIEIITPTLDDFCAAVLKSYRFVGMDSGTTHLAVQIAASARLHDRQIDIREIYNGLTPVTAYGISGEDTSILEYPYEAPSINADSYGKDRSRHLDKIPLAEIVDFITRY